MLLTISTTHTPATDIGFLLHKNPYRCQSSSLPFGKVHVFYPEVSEHKCTVALLLDIDPVELVRKSFNPQSSIRRVHECVFGVLALESEPVDPRL